MSIDFAVVVGAGVSGQAAARLLARNGARVRLLERNAGRIPTGFAAWAKEHGVEIRCGEHQPEDFAGADVVIPSPGVAASSIRKMLPATRAPEIMAETELAWRELHGERVIGITGTSGKTTTTSLCSAMLLAGGLRVFTGGNIGTPLSEYVLARDAGQPAVDAVVLELSSFQLQTCSLLRPDVGVLLNISENHLDYHADMQEYIDAKMHLFARQTPADTAILHKGLEPLAEAYHLAARRVYFDTSDRFTHMRLLGEHNKANAEAALLACRALGIDEAVAVRAAETFEPLEHRLERVAEHHGVLFVNDSKATTVEALRVALNAFDRPILLLAGGKFKGGDLDGLRPLIQQKVRHVALFGASRQIFEKAWNDIVPISYDTTLEAAMLRLAGNGGIAQPGDVVLLAPATSSFDQYTDYLHRGRDFKRIVKELLA